MATVSSTNNVIDTTRIFELNRYIEFKSGDFTPIELDEYRPKNPNKRVSGTEPIYKRVDIFV